MRSDRFLHLVEPLRRRHDLRWYFEHNPGRLMHKWMHYFAIYERHFAPYRRTAPTVLEIGVSHGGSLQMWKQYFGRGARIVGIDIEPRVVELQEPGIAIEVGDQSDGAFLRSIAERYGPFDIVVDDGSHLSEHQITSLEVLWPHVKDGGVYLIEDLHTSYWPEGYAGGLGVPSTFIEWLKPRLDDINAFHSREPGFAPTPWTTSIAGLHVYDSVAVLDKAQVAAPVVKMTGWPAFPTTYGQDTEIFMDEEHRAQLEALGRPMSRLGRLARQPVATSNRVLSRLMGRSSQR